MSLIKRNVGKLDATIRILLAVTIGILAYLNVISGTLAIGLGVGAAIFLVTGFLNFCPLYAIIRIKTNK